MKRFMLFTVVTFALALPAAAQRYNLANIPGLAGGPSTASAVNSLGQVAGWSVISSTSNHAILWSKTSGIRDLGTLGGGSSFATAINPSGQVVGFSDTTGFSHAFLWSSSSGMIDLGSLGTRSNATGINPSGAVTGFYSDSSNQSYAFSWTTSQGMQDLGFGPNSGPTGINDAGQIVGYSGASSRCFGVGHAFLWSPGVGEQSLDFPGAACTSAHAINKSGQVVGEYTTTSGGDPQAFLWSPSAGFQTLPSLGGATEAFQINSSGQDAGWSRIPVNGPFHAFLWSATSGIQDVGAPSNRASYPSGLNNHGEIVGLIEYYGGGFLHTFDWTPHTAMMTPNPIVNFANSPLNDSGQIAGGRGNGSGSLLLSPRMNVVLSSSRNPSKSGQSVLLTAKVKCFLGPAPDGEMVKFQQGTVTLATVALKGGVATLTTSTLPVGTDPITATYVGDVNYDASVSKVLQQVVNP